MVYAYIRVSCDKQNVENQRFEIQELAKREQFVIHRWIEETVSGTRNYQQRLLGRLIRSVGPSDTIICSELSRLGRNLYMIMEILSICMKRGCRLRTIKDNYHLGDDLQSKVLAFAFGLSAEIERSLISQRTREALQRKRSEGVRLGRPSGAKTSPTRHPLYKKEHLIASMMAEKKSMTEIARRLKCSRTTLYKYIRAREDSQELVADCT